MEHEALIPYVGVVTDIRRETPDVKTFRVVRKKMRLPYRMAPFHGSWPADYRPWSLRKRIPC